MYAILTSDHDLFSDLPVLLQRGGRALNQLADRLSPTTGLTGLPCMRAAVFGRSASRSFQYSRNSGSSRALVCAASTSKQRSIVLPCLLIAPSRWRPPVLSSLGFRPR